MFNGPVRGIQQIKNLHNLGYWSRSYAPISDAFFGFVIRLGDTILGCASSVDAICRNHALVSSRSGSFGAWTPCQPLDLRSGADDGKSDKP
jgi:hypothetical protein